MAVLVANHKKTKSWHKKIGGKTKSWYKNVGNGIKTVKTIRYLGINLRSNAKDFDRLGIEPKIKANVNKLKYVAKRNPMKGYSLYEAYIDSILKY